MADGLVWTPLAGWCMHLSGPVSATVMTDASGNYNFGSLPAGTYTFCEDVQTGWQATYPGLGVNCYTTDVAPGQWSAGWWFGNVKQ